MRTGRRDLRSRSTHLITLSLVALGGCALHQVQKNPPAPIDLPEQLRGAEEKDGIPLPERWWEDLGDEDLSALVPRAFQGSFRLRGAFARLDQAEAIFRQAGAAYWPQLSVDAAGGRQRVFFSPQIGAFEFNRFELSARASYELDVWGRLRSLRAASRLDQEASYADLQSLAMTLAAETGEAWYDLVGQRAQRHLLAEQQRTNDNFLELVRLRFTEGLVAAVDVHQQKQQSASVRAQAELVEAQVTVAENRLSVLLGQPPGQVAFPGRDVLPDVPALPGIGIPAAILARRPDVRAAQARVEAFDQRINAALADLLPALRLTGSAGFVSPQISDLFDTVIWSAFANLTQPVFEGGRRRAELARVRAAYDEAVTGYADVVLQALLEVENALVQERQQRRNIAALEEQFAAAQAALQETQLRYREGLTDYLPVLTALRGSQQVELSLVGARRQLLSFRIQLYRALGGTWAADLKRPVNDASGDPS